MRKPVVAGLLLGFGIALSSTGQIQVDAEAWRNAPRPVLAAGADTVPPCVRENRNHYFDRIYDPPGAFTSGPDPGPIFEEIPIWKDFTIAVVQFADYTTIQSASGRSIYTEIRMNVGQVLQNPSGAAVADRELTLILGGGTLELSSGKIVSRYLDQGSECALQPGHRYLAFLTYAGSNLRYFDCAKTWDLSTGEAVPTYPDDVKKAKNGTSRFAGMPEDSFIASVRGELPVGAR